MKKIFVYDCEIFRSEMLVCVGVDFKDVKKWAKKYSKSLTEILKTKENENLVNEHLKSSKTGGVFYFKKDNLRYYILHLKRWRNYWDDLDCLNHEVVHYRQFQFSDRMIENEVEFEAYFQENVFRELRQKLNKYLK